MRDATIDTMYLELGQMLHEKVPLTRLGQAAPHWYEHLASRLQRAFRESGDVRIRAHEGYVSIVDDETDGSIEVRIWLDVPSQVLHILPHERPS